MNIQPALKRGLNNKDTNKLNQGTREQNKDNNKENPENQDQKFQKCIHCGHSPANHCYDVTTEVPQRKPSDKETTLTKDKFQSNHPDCYPLLIRQIENQGNEVRVQGLHQLEHQKFLTCSSCGHVRPQ